MKESQSTYYLIERYLKGEMDTAEQNSFLSGLTPELKSKIKAHQLINVLVKENRLLNVKSIAQQSYKNELKTSKYIKAGIITATMSIAAFSVWFVTNNLSDKQLQYNPITTIVKNEAIIIKDSTLKSVKLSPDKRILIKKVHREKTANQNGTQATEFKPAVGLDSIVTKKIIHNISTSNHKEKEEISIITPCEKVKIIAKIYTTPSCTNENNGSISVSGYSGGNAPYKSILKQHNQTITTSFSELAQGNYQLLISDVNNCEAVEDIKIESKTCLKNYHFNPFIGEKWEIPLTKLNAELTIKDNAGNTYFSTIIPAGSQEYWTGMSVNGELKPGYYLYLIQYADGSINQGSVTIVQ
ncbi:MAG: SprB repeat-containing protein [Opitutaceae bacterium]|nr:SprB repeat-containing protein [Cytophagales bacterium]